MTMQEIKRITMQEIIGQNNLKTAGDLLKRYRLCIYIATIVVMAMIVGFIIKQSRQDYLLWLFLTITVSVVYSFGLMFFLSIKYKLTRKYYKLAYGLLNGDKRQDEGLFFGYGKTIEKDGVSFIECNLKVRALKRDDIDMVTMLVESTAKKIEFEMGDKVVFLACSNILLQWEKIINDK